MNLMPRKIHSAVVREDLYALTKDTFKALILHQFIYWSERMADVDRYIAEETKRCEQDGGTAHLSPAHGWVYKRAEELMEETLLSVSRQTVNRLLQSLVDDGYLLVRNNPEHKYDRTKQYRVDFVRIRNDLRAMGYLHSDLAWLVGDEDAMLTESNAMLKMSIGKSKLSYARSDNEPWKVQGERLNAQNERAISKITTEIKKDDDDLSHAHAQDDVQNITGNENEFLLPESSHHYGALGDSRDSNASNDFAWKKKVDDAPPPIEPDCSDAIALPPGPQSHEPRASNELAQSATASSTVLVAKEGLPPSPTVNDVCDAVDRRMTQHLGRWYIAKQGDYHAIVNLRAEGVPDEFILSGIDYTFEHFADKHPNSFAYCAKIIGQLWANEQEKAGPAEPIHWTAYQLPAQRKPSRPARNSLGSAGQKSERDERYSAFYELFPDA